MTCCDSCNNEISEQFLEHDEGVVTAHFVASLLEGFRVVSVTVAHHKERPAAPFLGGADRVLCAECLISTLQALAEKLVAAEVS